MSRTTSGSGRHSDVACEAEPIDDGLAQMLRCPTCGELMDDPHSLPCLHRFCRHCLNGHECGIAACRMPYRANQVRRAAQLGAFISRASTLM